MDAYTVRLGDEAGTDARLTGGKGASLGALVRAGFRVPDGFVVTTAAYRDFIDAAGLAGAAPERLREEIPRAEIPDPIAEAILAAYADLGAPAVAVRSSGTAEDLADASFAGQHDTYLNVSGPEKVLAAVRDCWASLWTERAVAYRGRYGWDETGLALAVVVQTMVDAEFAGVLFTADPVSGRRDRVVLEAVRGLGEALVSGEASGERYVVDRKTRAVLQGGHGLPQAALRELVDTSLDVEARFRGPQDIEWTYADGRIALVQARPLTALPDEPANGRSAPSAEKRGRALRMDYSMTADHMPYPPFPMDTALFLRPSVGWVVGRMRAVGFRVTPLDDVLVEIGDGVVQVVPPTVKPSRRALLGVPAALPKAVRLLRTRTGAWRARSEASLVRQARCLDAADLSAFTDDELLDRVRSLMHVTGELMPARFAAATAGVLAEPIAGLLLRLVVGAERAGRLRADLMAAVPCVTTAANDELGRIAEVVRATPELRAAYVDGDPSTVADRLAASATGRELLRHVDAYLRAYGFRELSTFTVGLPALRERPEIVHGLIRGRVLEPVPERDRRDRFREARRELAAERTLRARLARPVILRLFDSARDSLGFREDTHYQLTMVLAVARRTLLELGRRLVRRGALTDPDDIAYLTPEEVERLAPEEARATVARRKDARAAALDHYTIVPAEYLARADDGHGLTGTPASHGTAVGRVRVIRDESEFGALKPGEVLVCRYTNPTWTPLFALAAAVVVDSGGAASHAAIVAREHGIPAVMGTGDGTRTLTDGQRVLVDGDKGTVTPMADAGERVSRAAVGRPASGPASARTSPATSRGRPPATGTPPATSARG